MPAFRFNKAFKVARNVKAFLNLECGVTRGTVPDAGQLKIAEKQIENQRRRLGKQNREITRLKMRLSAVDGSAVSGRESREAEQTAGGSEAGALPDFLIIGAQKCGTTFFYSLLCQHPHIEPATEKEVHFFSVHFGKGADWYRSHFPPPKREEEQKVLTGEASPYYLFHPHAARRAAQIVPGAKLIALLRNPVDRAYSDYNHRAREGRDPLSFEEAIKAEEERLRGEREKMLADENYRSQIYRNFSYLSRGVYVDQLMEWRRYFDEDQMLVLKSEDFFERTEETLKRVQEFLGLPYHKIEALGVRHEGRYEREMDLATRRWLEAYFEPHNKRLYEYLGVDFGW